MSVFLDGTEIELTGRHFEQAYVGYSGNKQYWLHNIFIGHLWVSGRLNPGASDVCIGWKEQLENNVASLIKQGIPVWARMDNAYYRKEVVEWFEQKQWDFSISVTNSNNCRPVLDFVDGLPSSAWTPIRSDKTEAVLGRLFVVIKQRRPSFFTINQPNGSGSKRMLLLEVGMMGDSGWLSHVTV